MRATQGLALRQVDRISRCQLIKQPYLHPSAGSLRAKQKARGPRAAQASCLMPVGARGPAQTHGFGLFSLPQSGLT